MPIGDSLAALAAEYADHVKAGLWALGIDNPNAWGGAVEYMGKSAARFIAVQ